jgi:hypothetical protein
VTTLHLERRSRDVLADALAQYIENANHPEERSQQEEENVRIASEILDALDILTATSVQS